VIPTQKDEFYAVFNAIENRVMGSLKQNLQSGYPGIPFANGEFDFKEQRAPLDLPEYWLCDSMDGAIQYMQHLPGWTINLVLVRNGTAHFAAIYDPLAKEMFWAQEGQGAYLNDQPIHINKKTELWLMLATFDHPPFPKKFPGLNAKIGKSVENLLEQFGTVRNYGPHGLQLAHIAAGRIDVFYQEGLDTYNWLAGLLIAKEGGAEISTNDGSGWSWGAESLFVAPAGVVDRFLNGDGGNE
jgi:myo-inositol-1(or 4)-monophosphatase